MFAVSITARASSTSCSTMSKIGKSIFEYTTCVSRYLLSKLLLFHFNRAAIDTENEDN